MDVEEEQVKELEADGPGPRQCAPYAPRLPSVDGLARHNVRTGHRGMDGVLAVAELRIQEIEIDKDALGRHGDLLSQWQVIKIAASEALITAGGTITHHHAVGRDHRPWYDKQRPEIFAAALRAAKHALDPQGVLNPGVLIDP